MERGELNRSDAREVTMKRIVIGLLMFSVVGGSLRAQRRGAEGITLVPNPRPFAIAMDDADLQWYRMGSSVEARRGTPVGSGGVISAEMLKIPEPALREMQKFLKDFQAGKLDDSVKHVAKAIKIYPQWAAAHHTLAQTYARM